MDPPSQSPFCDNCQHNQAIVNKLMAEYIPDEDDPTYQSHVDTVDAYREEVEARYPQVCKNCIGRVRDQIRAAGYTARTDHLRRILENTKKVKLSYYSPRQIWTLRIIQLAQWAYIASTIVGVYWNYQGATALSGKWLDDVPEEEREAYKEIVDDGFTSAFALKLVKTSIIADLLTLWWNPKLNQLVTKPGGRMRRLIPLWIVRILSLGIRTAGFLYLRNAPSDDEELHWFKLSHGIVAASILISAIASWVTVRIEYQSTASFMQPLDPYLPNIPVRQTPQGEQQQRPVRPQADVFDSMAQSFTTSFNTPNPGGRSYSPPSPTLTATSMAQSDMFSTTTFQTPAKSSNPTSIDSMDWTPTRRGFANQQVDLQPHLFGPKQSQAPVLPREPHNIFAKPDTNPFRHKVPNFPQGPEAQKRNPWKSTKWAPVPAQTKKTFEDDMQQRGNKEQWLPKNVKRDKELFAEPKLKYDFQGYVGEKSTGLEEGFHNLFK